MMGQIRGSSATAGRLGWIELRNGQTPSPARAPTEASDTRFAARMNGHVPT